MTFAAALGKDLAKNKDLLRTRTFELNGHTFKVKVPLTVEMEAMQKRVSQPNKELSDKYYHQLTDEIVKRKDEMKGAEGLEIKDDDVLIEGKSLKELAVQKAATEVRIVEMFKLLIPEDDSFDMTTLTYDMVEELFPFAIQIEVMENIAKTISPEYSQSKKK